MLNQKFLLTTLIIVISVISIAAIAQQLFKDSGIFLRVNANQARWFGIRFTRTLHTNDNQTKTINSGPKNNFALRANQLTVTPNDQFE